tara:strand:+ start:1405 stop:1515 length:111 start_codon:yes stop_codon:yes gene_type:complete
MDGLVKADNTTYTPLQNLPLFDKSSKLNQLPFQINA